MPWNSVVCVHVLVAQSCLTLCNPKDSSWPLSSIHGIPQARKLETLLNTIIYKYTWLFSCTLWVSCKYLSSTLSQHILEKNSILKSTTEISHQWMSKYDLLQSTQSPAVVSSLFTVEEAKILSWKTVSRNHGSEWNVHSTCFTFWVCWTQYVT